MYPHNIRKICGEYTTRVVREYRVSGYANGGRKRLAGVVDEMQIHPVTRLQNQLNTP